MSFSSILSLNLSLSLSLDQAKIQITHNKKTKRFSTTNFMIVRLLCICCWFFLSYFIDMLMIYVPHIIGGINLQSLITGLIIITSSKK